MSKPEKLDRNVHFGTVRIIKVYYDGELDTKLDDQIKGFFRALGYDFYGSGYDLVKGRRDLAFEKPPMEAK